MKSVVLLSGGLDSVSLLYATLRAGDEVSALSFDYGQRHVRELQAACWFANKCAIPHQVIHVEDFGRLAVGSALTSHIAVPHGHYTEESMKATVVPSRNLLFLSCAISWAQSLHYDRVVYGAHSGDHAIYPDCRAEFVEALHRVAQISDWYPVAVEAPFRHLDKAGIIRVGATYSVPFEQTWTCYEGKSLHCGSCGSCVERREAFQLAEIEDPTDYAA